jgi:hypothetical protein
MADSGDAQYYYNPGSIHQTSPKTSKPAATSKKSRKRESAVAGKLVTGGGCEDHPCDPKNISNGAKCGTRE